VNAPWLQFLLLAAVGAASEWAALRALLYARPTALVTRNYRGAEVVSRGGVTLAAPLVVGTFLAWLLRDRLQFGGEALCAAAASTALYGALGWLDDARGTTGVRGLKGHFARLLRSREVTTGLVKAIGGAVLGLWAAYFLGAHGWTVLLGGVAIALSANTVNALDVRPGRAAKLYLAASLVCLAFAWATPVRAPLVVLVALLGAMLAFGPADLREQVMLGDTGANPLGAALGMTVVAATHWPWWLALSAALLAFSLAADRWSLTEVVGRVGWLRWVDELGRPRPRT
jgi:UDP-N-acetylmuramyl pentapeptide phosphotransferase/UDP-N-acetylglucosamine-1-phosphate transferase